MCNKFGLLDLYNLIDIWILIQSFMFYLFLSDPDSDPVIKVHLIQWSRCTGTSDTMIKLYMLYIWCRSWSRKMNLDQQHCMSCQWQPYLSSLLGFHNQPTLLLKYQWQNIFTNMFHNQHTLIKLTYPVPMSAFIHC